MTIQEEMGFGQKLSIIQEFPDIVDLLQEPLAHGYTFFPYRPELDRDTI